jgi:hypothetical protein
LGHSRFLSAVGHNAVLGLFQGRYDFGFACQKRHDYTHKKP